MNWMAGARRQAGRGPGRGPGGGRAVIGVAVVADELDGGCEAAGGAGPGAGAGGGPAEVVGEGSGRCVPDRLRIPGGGDQVEGGAVAVGVVAGLAGRRDAQVVATQDPDGVVVEAGGEPGRPGGARGGPQRRPAGRGPGGGAGGGGRAW